jgi:4,5:9,10-diseco-3-hydroxy-5,9,17-trioxoandrosta-1(10),2-diene-4-oate hydrolase
MELKPWSPSDGLKHLLGYYDGEGPTREKVATFLRDYLVFDGSAITSIGRANW